MAKTEERETEEKVKEAARKVFIRKGFAATRMRDIAEEASLNLALPNYYFRSKQELFRLIMEEKIQQFFSAVIPVVDDDGLTLDEKLERLVENYVDMLVENPDMPIFVLSELRTNPDGFKTLTQIQKILQRSSLVRQMRERRPDVEPIQFVTSILGMIVFPFVSKPVLFPENETFGALMEERKTLVANWAKGILNI